AIIIRSTNRPIAAMSATNMIVRAATSEGVAAVSEMDGITNCGAGPGFGPSANVYAPRTGCPSAEITRQYTRYQPSGIFFSGTTSVFGSVGERSGGPAVTWLACASVTETIAKRGSTGSLYVSEISLGAWLTVPLAVGTVRSSAACAHAAAGSASAAASASRTVNVRTRGLTRPAA